MSRNPLELHLESLIAAKCESIQIALKGAAPIGPGKVEVIHVTPENLLGDHAGTVSLYKITVRAHVGQPSAIPGMPPALTEVCLPMVFRGDDILWISEGPLDSEGKPMVIDPPRGAPPPQRRGGLSFGG
jgi:hypothetical protein